ncbi:MAG: hypothetical protein Cons2KO_30240 [Congregibacter sp.]
MDPIKNHAMMLRAFKTVLETTPDARLLLVGDGEERARIASLISHLGIADRVVMPGFIPDPSVWLDAMDLYLLSSFSEGTSMTLLEATSLGKPCIVTDVGGNPEVISDGESGFCVPSDDIYSFAQAIVTLLNDKPRLIEMGERAGASFQTRFHSQIMLEQYHQLYRN